MDGYSFRRSSFTLYRNLVLSVHEKYFDVWESSSSCNLSAEVCKKIFYLLGGSNFTVRKLLDGVMLRLKNCTFLQALKLKVGVR